MAQRKAPSPNPHIPRILPYVPGRPIEEVQRQYGLKSVIKLASNENPLGAPESAKKAMAAAVEDLGRYPDSNGFELKAALAARYGVPMDWITLGNGSNDILELAAAATLTHGFGQPGLCSTLPLGYPHGRSPRRNDRFGARSNLKSDLGGDLGGDGRNRLPNHLQHEGDERS